MQQLTFAVVFSYCLTGVSAFTTTSLLPSPALATPLGPSDGPSEIAPTTASEASALMAQSLVALQRKDFPLGKRLLDACVAWGETAHDPNYLTNVLWLRGITEVDLLSPGVGSPAAEADFKRAADLARAVENFDLVRLAELEQQRGVNLENLNQLPQALVAFRDGADVISRDPDLVDRLSPASNKQIELLYDVGTTDQLTGDYDGAVAIFIKAATLVRGQMRLTPTNTQDYNLETEQFADIIRRLKESYDKQGQDGLAKVTDLIHQFEREEAAFHHEP